MDCNDDQFSSKGLDDTICLACKSTYLHIYKLLLEVLSNNIQDFMIMFIACPNLGNSLFWRGEEIIEALG